jgi:tRNA threonylcarbamoyladenosine biosynthesis protein TsaB
MKDLFLLIETSHAVGSIALYEQDQLIDESFSTGTFQHAEWLGGAIESILERTKIQPNQITSIGISEGPGSYTGLRIGVSWVKGFCMALDIPFVGCSVTQALSVAAQENNPNEPIIFSIIDARRMEIYGEFFHNKIPQGIQSIIIDESFVEHWKKLNPLMAGDGFEKLSLNFDFPWKDSGVRFSSARHLFPEFFRRWEAREFENIYSFEPEYVKPVHLVPSKKTPLIQKDRTN